ncbi:MAG: hypothetical protein ACRC8S_18815 [Fimbriiglobus sp.]
MLLHIIRVVFAVTVLPLLMSCNRVNETATSPLSAAYTDGFEVVVFDLSDDGPANVRSVTLAEAERAITSGSRALIPGDPTAIQRQIPTGNGDSTVLISVQQLAEGKQQIQLSFHKSNRTYVYEYVVDDSVLRPVASEYRDLACSKLVRYVDK